MVLVSLVCPLQFPFWSGLVSKSCWSARFPYCAMLSPIPPLVPSWGIWTFQSVFKVLLLAAKKRPRVRGVSTSITAMMDVVSKKPQAPLYQVDGYWRQPLFSLVFIYGESTCVVVYWGQKSEMAHWEGLSHNSTRWTRYERQFEAWWLRLDCALLLHALEECLFCALCFYWTIPIPQPPSPHSVR